MAMLQSNTSTIIKIIKVSLFYYSYKMWKAAISDKFKVYASPVNYLKRLFVNWPNRPRHTSKRKQVFKKYKNVFHIISIIPSSFPKFSIIFSSVDTDWNFSHRSFFICDKTASTTQAHAVSMTRNNWKLGVVLKSGSFAFLDVEFEKQEGLFQGGECRELAIKKSE